MTDIFTTMNRQSARDHRAKTVRRWVIWGALFAGGIAVGGDVVTFAAIHLICTALAVVWIAYARNILAALPLGIIAMGSLIATLIT